MGHRDGIEPRAGDERCVRLRLAANRYEGERSLLRPRLGQLLRELLIGVAVLRRGAVGANLRRVTGGAGTAGGHLTRAAVGDRTAAAAARQPVVLLRRLDLLRLPLEHRLVVAQELLLVGLGQVE